MQVTVENPDGSVVSAEHETPSDAILWVIRSRIPEGATVTMKHPNGSEVVL